MSPRLSICVPSRNRQVSFRQTIRDLLANPRGDVEFVFADNSDDGAIMDAFIAGLADPRIRYLKSSDHPLPMQDNWDRTMAAASGDWIVFIGDDDYVDPDVLDTIAEIAARRPTVDAVGWNRMSFKWPEYRPFRGNTCLSLGNSVTLADRDKQFRTMFLWEGAAPIPKVAFGAYHGAVRRDVMERIRTTFCGRYFEHPTVDFDCSFKLLLTARELVYIDRPFSVLGTTSSSNSAAVGRFERVGEIHDEMTGQEASYFEDPAFPFTSRLGVASSILAAQHWFKTKYGIRFDGWEENFTHALAIDCGHAEDKVGFDRHAAQCRDALSQLQGGRLLAAFNPRFLPRRNSGVYTGLRGQYLFIDETIAACRTPAEFYGIAQSVLEPPSELKYHFDQAKHLTPMVSAA
ncbi:glycosyltransferase family 2 protein [Rhizobium sp. TH2]|uniref:glycosyltransferase family 2 protein n=1 Tax=Rhizobium sp. TH2 TaxID=2775403 RepID=UPI00215773E5|nr:glycosyltransferase family 2 protein [Rhizobium sp. TH2]UVC07547.1 glycosyltransferase family 2 protein [Rhizobium sp. TH2]